MLGSALVAIGVAVLLYAERAGLPRLRWWGKPLASAGFLLAALRAPAIEMPAPDLWLLLAALTLGAAGDVLLIPKGQRWFAGGMGAFALAHLCLIGWFAPRAQPLALGAAAAVLLGIGHLGWRWLSPHLTGPLRLPVRLYLLLLSVMAASAVGYIVSSGTGTVRLAPAVGALLLYLSDIAVARHRFIARSFVNRAWGLPVYYLGMTLIAWAVGAS